MKSRTRFASFFVALMMGLFTVGPQAHAMCMPIFFPPDRVIEVADTQAFVGYDGLHQTLIVEPTVTGDAEDFGIVLPLPAQPEVFAGEKEMFPALEDITNPVQPVAVPMAFMAMEDAAPSATERVVVVEQKRVGEFDASVLYANSTKKLTQWLDENGYNYTNNDVANFQSYYDNGYEYYYFVAIKFNTEFLAEESEAMSLQSENTDQAALMIAPFRPVPEPEPSILTPIGFKFAAEAPFLPVRGIAGDMPQMVFTLYTLGDDPIFAPGGETVYLDRVDLDTFQAHPWMAEYSAFDKHLMRQRIVLDPKLIRQDIPLIQVENPHNHVIDASNPVFYHPELHLSEGGIVMSTNHTSMKFTDTQVTPKPIAPPTGGNPFMSIDPFPYTRLLKRGVSGDDVRILQQGLSDLGFAPGPIDGIFGAKTDAALKEFQRGQGLQKIDGIFGPNTHRALFGQ